MIFGAGHARLAAHTPGASTPTSTIRIPATTLPGPCGIGKLATYVLANELTYLVLKDGVYRAITMDYGQVRGGMSDPHQMNLMVAELSADQARDTLETP